ncbi:TMV resistance protein N-like [Pyrus ussuriensis x Pyrus communis]|uniref:TMV resistance protein N-like n=1 Tax=Pyrus ussuriensis x Pyrus communis TaxID=2448454 RepID=A0A5N5HWW1_9ROSA|nr:TMV resistance protein N-like [Pyrus ussuriensis x Pyrus communis]
MIGIYGMPGVGKSTIAKALSQRIRNQFEAFSFISKGTDAVKGIFLSSPKQEKVHLKKDTFSNMDDLKLLKIHNVIFSGCLESLSDELRLLEWHEYPLKLLPSSFEPENLVELHLPRSKIEKLWEEFEKPLETLVILNLTDCEKLIETPDFGEVPNLEQLILKGCTSLSEVPDIINLRSLTTFILSGCSRLEKLPEIGEDMKQLRELHLDGTAIEVLPTSIKHVTGLIVLNLKDCKNLLSLPDIICTSLTSLQTLTISGCANLEELPENLGCLKCLQELDASGTAIKQLPASIKDLTRLSELYLRYCKNLCSLPATICTSLTLLQILNLSGCSNLDELPENLGSLECLQELYAGGTAISEVPESISQLSQLGELVLDDCCKLQSWPKLPFSIRWVRAHNCPLLEGAHSDKIMVWNSPAAGFSFIDRRSDKTKGQAYWLPPKYLLRESYQTLFEDAIHRSTMLQYSYRSNKIPAWLSRQSTESTVTIPLPRDVDGIGKWMGLALCFVCVGAQKHDNLEDEPALDEKLQSNLTRNFRIDLYTTEDPHELPQVLNYGDLDFTGPFIHWLYIPRSDLEECSNKRFIRALITPDSPEVKVTECGASQINSEDVTTFVRKLIKHNKNFSNGHQPEEEDEKEDGMRSVPSTSGVQIQQELQKEETTSSTPICVCMYRDCGRGLPNIHDYGFIFSRREKLQWFSEQSTTSACTVNLTLPPYLRNDEKWAGLSLYVVCSLPQGVQRSRIYYECHLYTPIEAVGVEALVHRLMLASSLDDNVGSHRLLIVHIPRVPLFGCRTPGVKVEMCGMRLVYDQDLKVSEVCPRFMPIDFRGETYSAETSQHERKRASTIALSNGLANNISLDQSRKTSGSNYDFLLQNIARSHGHDNNISLDQSRLLSNGSSVRVPLPPNLYSDTNWKGLALCAYFSVGENPTAELDNSNRDIPHHLICVLESEIGTIEPIHYYCTTNEEFQWLYFGGFIWVSYIPRASFSDQLNGCSIVNASIASDHEACNVHSCLIHNMMLSDKKGKNKQCAEGNSESSSRCSSYITKPPLERLVKPSHRKWDFDRFSVYNSCFPSNIDLEWFGHQSNDYSLTISLPQNLNMDSNWLGLAVCANFAILEHLTSEIDKLDIPEISHNLSCHFETDKGNSLHHYCTSKEEFMWLHLGGFVWVSYLPRVWFSDQLNECSSLEASVCGLRLLYQHDEEEFTQAILQYMTSLSDKKGKNKQTPS